MLIAPPALIGEFAQEGKSVRLQASVGRVGLGVAVRPDAPLPDISSAAALQRTVIEAESLTFNTASTGLYFEGLLKKMGIYESVQAKTTRYPDGASVMEHLLKGKGREVGFGPITEILQFRDRGLRLVGPLPAEVQLPAVLQQAERNNNGGTGVQNLDDMERNAIIQALAQCHGNKKKAAQVLGIQRPTLYNKMKRYAIEL